MKTLPLWEIYVPCVYPDGKVIEVKYHRAWDRYVLGYSGGLTRFPPIKGVWVSSEGQIINEKMIPVRFTCPMAEICNVLNFTKQYYTQKEVMVTKISDHCIIG